MLLPLFVGVLGLLLLGWGITAGFGLPRDRRAAPFAGRLGCLLNVVVLVVAALLLWWAFFSLPDTHP
jgi:hypothetical protein